MKKISLTKEEADFLFDVLSDRLVFIEKCIQRGFDTKQNDDTMIRVINKKRMTARLISKLYE